MFSSLALSADEIADWQKAEITEVWQPVPETVTFDQNNIPSDAIILFDGTSLSNWQSVDQGPVKWQVKDGAMTVVAGTGDIKSKEAFCDVQLHVEWKMPTQVTNDKGELLTGQGRNNSGVFFQQRYEIQVLDSYNNKTYSNGQAGAVYKQHIPLVNATKAPGEWQSYDIVFTAPLFNDAGRLKAPATITAFHNGVLVQNHVEIQGVTEWIGAPTYTAHGCDSLRLQDHGNPVSFRNIWLRKL
ncbi:3-keto-disaccharide hydrolase [Neptunicella sp. SCSIO 80796]|uniref:3-keto-disaccharide hydrolase n=1 Tax=Neptunicella plasticusilytica TaxID=3117012 RepID=UPI003A4D7855